MSSNNDEKRANDENLTSILKHEKRMKEGSKKGLRFEASSSEGEDENETRYTRVTRRSTVKTRSRTRKEEHVMDGDDSD